LVGWGPKARFKTFKLHIPRVIPFTIRDIAIGRDDVAQTIEAWRY